MRRYCAHHPPMNAKLLAVAVFSILQLFRLSAGGQVPDQLKHSFINPNTSPQGGTHLGSSVAMDGDYTVVGAPGDMYQEGFPGGGVVKVFHSTTGALLFTILGPNKDFSGFIGGKPFDQVPFFIKSGSVTIVSASAG